MELVSGDVLEKFELIEPVVERRSECECEVLDLFLEWFWRRGDLVDSV